ncbi:transcriptional regulator [Paenibacillus donghaensis]|uniref:Transcriptional regulator n=1 Tax=Paenibacillus donghaensis TaxID=414771 RepID=A0A2Z2KSA1_9BACL|nr:transcriptional regulator [Paenibacillus donghaensis]ASA21998.1 transcriptional regulator [Paenibacillus donghaensis]
MAIGQFGPALEEALKRTGDTREKAGKAIHADASLVGKIAKGSRKATNPVMQAAAEHYDDGQLFLAAAAEVTGGAFVPWLDAADLHRSTTTLKTLEEIEEVEEALQRAPITKRPDQLSPSDRESIKTAIMEQIEAVTALVHNITALCRAYGFSFSGMFKAHREEMREKKYMK